MASVSTRTISSRYSRQSRKVSSPTCFTATPSAKSPTSFRATRSPFSRDRAMAQESSGSTPMIRISGRRRFT